MLEQLPVQAGTRFPMVMDLVTRTVSAPLNIRADHSDLAFAINDAFKRARRRLQDHARRLEGQVKRHESQPIGTVTRLDGSGEFGFLESGDGREIYFHRNSVLNGDFDELRVGDRGRGGRSVREPGAAVDDDEPGLDAFRSVSGRPGFPVCPGQRPRYARCRRSVGIWAG